MQSWTFGTYTDTVGTSGLQQNKAAHITKHYLCKHSHALFFFVKKIVQVSVEQPQKHLDTLNQHSPLSTMTIKEM